jgi:hypothetical protein
MYSPELSFLVEIAAILHPLHTSQADLLQRWHPTGGFESCFSVVL